MKIGKIHDSTFRELILNRLGKRGPTVIVPPRAGVDAGVADLGGGQVLVVAENPIFTRSEGGWPNCPSGHPRTRSVLAGLFPGAGQGLTSKSARRWLSGF